MKKLTATLILSLTLAAGAHAANAKWESINIGYDTRTGIEEMKKYCITHDVTMNDLLWANHTRTADITPGTTIYLPTNQTEVIAIWQHVGALKAREQSSTVAEAKEEAAAEVSMQETAQTQQEAPAEKSAYDELLSEMVRDSKANAKKSAPDETAQVKPEQEAVAEPVETAQAQTEAQKPEATYNELLAEMLAKSAQPKQEQNVITADVTETPPVPTEAAQDNQEAPKSAATYDELLAEMLAKSTQPKQEQNPKAKPAQTIAAKPDAVVNQSQ